MKRKKISFAAVFVVVLTGGAGLIPVPSFAAETIDGLKQQIAVLEKRVGELEAGQAQKDQTTAAAGERWDPLGEMQRMQEEVGRMFQDSFIWAGPVGSGIFGSNMRYDDYFNIQEESDKYVITFDLSGLDQNKVDIEVNENSITVKGEYSRETNQQSQNEQYVSKSYASFLRSVPVPQDADTTNMKTEKQGDKLVITLPKKAAAVASGEKASPASK